LLKYAGLIVAAIVCQVGVAAAAPFTGEVLDGVSFRPIKGATIVVLDGGETVTSNARGRYRVKDAPVGKIKVDVSADGYQPRVETVKVRADGKTHAVVILVRPGVMSEIIAVTSGAPVSTTAPGKQNIAREELTRIPGTQGDALQSIKSMPGVANVDAPGAGPGLIVIRGAAPEDSKITIDGIEVPLVYHFFGLQSVLPSEFIDTIEFLPGGFEADEGRSTGGVINILTRANEAEELRGFAELSFINFAGFLQGPVSRKRKMYFSLGLRRSAIDLLLPQVVPDTVSFTTAPQYYDAQARFDWRPNERHRLSTLAMFSYDLLKLLNDNVSPNEPLLSGRIENRTSFSRLIGTWQYTGPKLQSRFVTAAGTQGILVRLGENNFGDADVWRIEAREDARYKLHSKLQLRFGGEARLARGHMKAHFPLPPAEGTGGVPNLSSQPVIELDDPINNQLYAAYVMADVKPFKDTTITPGLRLDHFQRFAATALMPRLSFRQRINKNWKLRAALGAYTRPLERNEALATHLEPEEATQYVLGADYKIARGVRASFSTFYTDRRKLVVFEPNMQDALSSYANLGYGRAFGAEGLVRVKRNNLFGWVSYTLSRSDRVDGPTRERRLFDFDQTHNFLIVGSYTLGAWQFGGRWQYSTGNPLTPVLGGIYVSDRDVHIPVLGALNSDRIDAAHQLDFRIDRTWTFRTWKLSAYLDVTNVYLNPKTLGFSYNFNYSQREPIEELPILPALGIRGSF